MTSLARRFASLCAAVLLTACAHAAVPVTYPIAHPRSSPLARGEVSFRHAANGMQYPHYAARADQSCAPAQAGDLRQRLIDLAAQEWARFGYPLSQRANADELALAFPELTRANAPYIERDPLMLQAIGGYWAALSGVASGWIFDIGRYEILEANALWEQSAREYRANPGWRTPWSAAFISWVMCEGGVQDFRRSWAHRDYVDAAIAAADGTRTHPYIAHDANRVPLAGDLICSGRGEYRPVGIAGRREDPYNEAEMHCDLVVATDASVSLLLAIGGNLDNAVALVPYRLIRDETGVRVRSVCLGEKVCTDERIFAVLALAAPESAAALAQAPALATAPDRPPPRFE